MVDLWTSLRRPVPREEAVAAMTRLRAHRRLNQTTGDWHSHVPDAYIHSGYVGARRVAPKSSMSHLF